MDMTIITAIGGSEHLPVQDERQELIEIGVDIVIRTLQIRKGMMDGCGVDTEIAVEVVHHFVMLKATRSRI